MNLKCLVLCLKVYIPKILPILPPNKAKIKSVFSLILHWPFLALYLSKYIKIKDKLFINNIYIIKILIIITP